MTTYYVRPDGNDSNDGLGAGTDRAWATAAKPWVSANAADDIVHFAPGSYGLVSGTEKNHGSYANPIWFIGNPTGTVFGVSPGIIQWAGLRYIPLGTGSRTFRYVFFKNMFVGYVYLQADYLINPQAVNTGFRFINCVLYSSNLGYSFAIVVGTGASSGITLFYNCSILSSIRASSSGTLGLYNCATLAATISASFAQDYCIGPNVGGTNSIVADPLFTDTATLDYTLQSISQGIDSGYDFGVDDEPDVYGYTRVRGLSIDRGASEHQMISGATVATRVVVDASNKKIIRYSSI